MLACSQMLLHALVALLPFLTAQGSKLPKCPKASKADYDYIVVGSGAGGGPFASRLAEAGYSVLVVDAGHDVQNVNTTIPVYFGRSCQDPQIELNYTVNEYPPGFPFQVHDSWYPRARALGGSTIHNALVNVIGNTAVDFNGLESTFNDPNWSRKNMQNYWKKIERNLYLPHNNTDHGFHGWLKTNLNPSPADLDPKLIDAQLTDLLTTLVDAAPPVADINSLAGDEAVGAFAPSYTTDEVHNRTSVRDRLTAVHASGKPLHFQLDTLVTKVLLCDEKSPKAYGVEIAPGAALAVASNFHGKKHLHTKTVTARHEVIVSAGTFQSPQLLMLSGIGDSKQLKTHGIEPIVHLPGVGANLRDHDEVALIWHTKQNYSIWNGCTILSDPNQDPCLRDWIDSGHENLYSFGVVSQMVTRTSVTNPGASDPAVVVYFGPAQFPGFVRDFPQQIADNHNAVVAVTLKAHANSRGSVRLTGGHPQDKVDIQKNHFQGEEAAKDVIEIREGIRRARQIIEAEPFAQHIEKEIFPGSQAQTDEEIDAHIFQHVFGHHACCTNSMGPDSDPNAVLDGELRVRGVKDLRVIDASSWPHVPGYFVTSPTYMLAERAADMVLSTAAAKEVVNGGDEAQFKLVDSN